MTVHQNVALPLRVAGLPVSEVGPRVDQALELVGPARAAAAPRACRAGKSSASASPALVSRPEILLCDEATSALDAETTGSSVRLLRDINRRFGLTVV